MHSIAFCHPWVRGLLAGLVVNLGALLAWSQTATITEFMAMNESGLKDEDGDYSDWIEVLNPTAIALNLDGYSLTDDPAEPAKWRFPARVLAPGDYVLVFASGKDRRPAQGNLHSNFRLAGEGGYLALVAANGSTIAKAFAPYPPQRADFSFGSSIVENRLSLVKERAPARILVPTSDGAGLTWTGGQEPFDDRAWLAGTNAIGYQSSAAGFAVQNFKSAALVEDLGAAEEVIASPALQTRVSAENAPTIDYLGTVDNGHYAVDRPFPGTSAGEDEEDFVVLVTGKITVPTAGAWTFGVLSDDGFGMSLTRGTTRFEIAYPDPRSPSDTLGTLQIVEPGDYDLRLVYYERGGGSGLELFAAKGTYTTWNATAFRLVGDTAGGGLAVRSTPVASGSGSLGDYIGTDLQSQMFGLRTSAFVRIPFTAPEISTGGSLVLNARYDDGFVAYLNGSEVARRNVPTEVRFNSVSVTNRASASATRPESIILSISANALRRGDGNTNILALQGLNDRADSPEFLLSATLESVSLNTSTDGFFTKPTPGGANTASFAGFIAAPEFSVGRGFAAAPFDLRLTCETESAVIRYTTNGSPPSATNGFVYAAPLRIDRTSVVRAAAFKTGYRDSTIVTHTYLFLDDVISQTQASTLAAGFPRAWNGTAADYGLDPRVIGQNGTDRYSGKYARTIRDDLKAIPTLSLVMNVDDMFGTAGIYSNPQNRGPQWEKPVSVELIYPDRTNGFQVNAGLQIQGGAFRGFSLTKKKSFRLMFKSDYGAGKLRYPFFGLAATDEFNTIALRANNNDGYQWDSAGGRALYVRDAFALESARAMGMVVPHTTFVHLYINGFYWGLYNPVERPDAAFSASYFGGAREDWDAINYDSAPDGNYQAWNRMVAMANAGLASNANYQKIQGNNPDGTRNPQYEDLLDVDNLIDYMLVNLYGGNEDWPHRNWYAGRSRVGGDGFRFYPWDTEAALNLWATLNSDRTGVNNAVAVPYAAARANADFRMRFADHVYRHFFNGGIFYVDSAAPQWDPSHPERNRPAALFVAVSAKIERAMVGESARWGDQHASTPYTRDEHWAAERTNMLKNYFPQRSAIVLEQLRRANLYPRTEPPTFSQRGGQVPVGFALTLTAPQGTIYYTTDGTDPRAPVTVEETFQLPLIGNDAPKRAMVPSAANGGNTLGSSWRGGAEPFNDSAWKSGAGGVGYDRESTYVSLFGIDVRTDMDTKNGSAFIRIPFRYDGAQRDRLNFMSLRVRYDDGFVAYLNGVQIAAVNAPANLTWDALSSAGHDDTAAISFEEFKVDAFLSALKTGTNVLAIQGLNNSLSSTDFLIGAELVAGERRTISGTNQALVYRGPLVLTNLTTLKTRVLNGAEWSALNEAKFIVGSPKLLLTELHYHPADASIAEQAAGFSNADDFEFLEFFNAGTVTCDLEGLRFTNGIQFDFARATATSLLPGDYLLLVKNRAAFEKRYGSGLPIVGEYGGRLDNAGERLVLVGPKDEPILDFTFGTKAPWPEGPDGDGPSLELADLKGELNAPESWRASAVVGGSPGGPSQAPIRIATAKLVGAQLRLEFNGQPGAAYRIEVADSLPAGAWRAWREGDKLDASGAGQAVIDILATDRARFFRVLTP